MTPYTVHSNDLLNIYVADLARSLTAAYSETPATWRIRRTVARAFVRIGAWLMPDKPALVSDTILVLPKASDRPTIRNAA
jgi:hypothetical protein